MSNSQTAYDKLIQAIENGQIEPGTRPKKKPQRRVFLVLLIRIPLVSSVMPRDPPLACGIIKDPPRFAVIIHYILTLHTRLRGTSRPKCLNGMINGYKLNSSKALCLMVRKCGISQVVRPTGIWCTSHKITKAYKALQSTTVLKRSNYPQ